MSNTTQNSEHLIRAEIWSSELKEILDDEMQAQKFVRNLDGFPDGDTFTIPSIGQLQVDNYDEGEAIKYRPMDTGEFQFSIDQYVSSGWKISVKAQQDLFYAAQLEAKAVPQMEHALMRDYENATFAAAEKGVAANSNEALDGIEHRWAAGGSGAMLQLEDFARARYALKKANVADTGMVAIVDPSVEYTLNTLTNLADVSNNPRWEGIVSDGIATGMKFVKNVYGFDVYTSNYLPDVTDGALNTAADSAVDFSSDVGKANMFFSTSTDLFVGAWRQMPKVDYSFDMDHQEHKYALTARYGVKKYRPENLVVVPSKTNV